MTSAPRIHKAPAPHRVVLVLVRNILIAREPMYGVSQWARKFAPDLLDLYPDEIELLNDDRIGRTLHELFDHWATKLPLEIVGNVIQQFQLDLGELHNDSTTVSFFGAYEEATEERQVGDRKTLAIASPAYGSGQTGSSSIERR